MPDYTVRTAKNKQVVDITANLNTIIQEAGFRDGLCHVFCLHTTAALTAADLDPGTDLDMLDAFTTMVPKLKYRHPHDPSHTPDHILSAMLGPDITVPVRGGRLVLGTWQRVVLFEFDGPRQRNLVITFIPQG
ncbi:MAG: YjbQ family protein [Anaerolineae bacterium]|nr:YjbQ family protein [Anaerolineae bacterium]